MHRDVARLPADRVSLPMRAPRPPRPARRHQPEHQRGEWRLDRARGTATLISPQTALGEFTVPLAPMLGCFGVAPAQGQAISTATSAEHGGNMDYRGFVAGVTVYFPVFVPGALFHLGDGHAVKGVGEVVGTGIGCSCDVQFTVRLIKVKRIGWPRGEDANAIFTAGNARPLDQALQHATSEMLRWLQEDYGLDGRAASTLLGRPGTLADVANAAVFAASDWARTMTATKLNITAGSEVD